jgi:hypothetical protein
MWLHQHSRTLTQPVGTILLFVWTQKSSSLYFSAGRYSSWYPSSNEEFVFDKNINHIQNQFSSPRLIKSQKEDALERLFLCLDFGTCGPKNRIYPLSCRAFPKDTPSGCFPLRSFFQGFSLVGSLLINGMTLTGRDGKQQNGSPLWRLYVRARLRAPELVVSAGLSTRVQLPPSV